MDQQTIIADIEAQARRIGVSMSDVCRRAEIHPTTFSRWKKSERNPEPTGATIKSLTALQAALAALSAEHAGTVPPASSEAEAA